MLLPPAVCIAAVVSQVAAPSVSGVAADRAALLAGVREIAAPGLPGSVGAFGQGAFALVLGKSEAGDEYVEPVVGAARLGRGRIVAFGHTGYLGADALATADTGRLLVNALRWTVGGGRQKPRVALIGGDEKGAGTRAFLEKQGMTAAVLAPGAVSPDRLRDFDVVCGTFSELPKSGRTAVVAFVRAGGGLVGAETGWGWRQLHPGRPLGENGGNEIVAVSGLLWAGGTLARTSANGFAVRAEDARLDAANASVALDRLTGEAASSPDAARAVWTVTQAAQAMPENDALLLPRLRALAKTRAADFSDMAARPVTLARPLDRLALTLQVRDAQSVPADKVTAHPSAASFPGAVAAGAPRVTKTVAVDTRIPGWHGTGVYAAPGERLVVRVPAGAAGQGLRVRIGTHTDTLWHLPVWKRAPEITRTFPLDAASVTAANPFGGTVLIEAPENGALGTISVSVAGGVLQPRFVRGETSRDEWRTTLRNAPAPWAELEGRRCILSLPSSTVRTLDDPDALMAYWDEVVERCEKLYAARPRVRPERFCVDRQISAGYMHSGYPIMTGEDVAARFADLSVLRGPDGNKTWGFYHELAHNYQVGDWTWDGGGEVTNNLFSLYATETFNAATENNAYVRSHPAVTPGEQEKRRAAHRAAGSRYEDWKRDPFLALGFFLELRQAFGWEPFTKVFAEYRDLPAGEKPRSDGEKRDQFLVRFSRVVGRDLGPFFQAWGVPTSDAARAAVAGPPIFALP